MASSFEEGCLKAVNLGDNADTTGAVYGQLAGSFYGNSAVPASWCGMLAHLDLIAGYAERLHDFAPAADG